MDVFYYDVANIEENEIISLGISQETNVRQIVFGCGSLVEAYGDGNAQIINRRPKELVGYCCEDVVKDGDNVIWTVNSDDTAFSGRGHVQLRWYVNGALKESFMIQTYIRPSITSITDLPAEVKSALDLIMKYVEENTIDIDDLDERIANYFDDHPLPVDGLDTELRDIRVGADGTVYQSAGDAVRGQVSDLKQEINTYSALDYQYCTNIIVTAQNPVDYNDFTTPGSYFVGTASQTQMISNIPEKLTVAHRLFVISTINANRIIQIIIASTAHSQIYIRFYNGSAWGNWNSLITDEFNPLTVTAANTITLQNTDNLDTLINPGNYRVLNASTATAIGFPLAVGGRVTVMSLSAESLIYQFYMRQDISAGIYVRFGNVADIANPQSTVWTEWKHIVDDVVLTREFTNTFSKNENIGYYLLDKDKYSVGSLTSGGSYTDTIMYRICTPDKQTALTDLFIQPREGYRVTIRLYTDDVVTESVTSDGTRPVFIPAGQVYKFYIRKVGESSSSPAVTVNEMYDKAMFFNMRQNIQSIALMGDKTYLNADYGLVPCGTYYSGIDEDAYNIFDYDSTTEEVYTAFDALVTNNTNLITKTDLGLCSDGTQHIYLYDFSPNQYGGGGVVYDNIPALFLLCGQHGYEKASTFSAYYLFKHLIENDTDNPILDYLRNHFRIICIPVANPYGFNQKIYKNYNGVNLNRNWDTPNWGTGEGENDPTSKDYAGSAPFSEPETVAARNAFNTYKDYIYSAIDYHTNGYVPIDTNSIYNVILYTDKTTPMQTRFKKAVRYHIKNITAHFNKQYSLNLADNQFCGSSIITSSHYGRAGIWFENQEKIACTFETFPGFQNASETYTPNVIKASEELISNFLITLLNYTKGV